MPDLTHDFDAGASLRGTDSLKWNRYPGDVLPMWVADMDFCCPEPLLKALKRRIEVGTFGYPLLSPEFSRAVAGWMRRRFQWTIQEEWVCFVNAVVPGLVNAIQAFTRPGAKVLIPSPVYHPFHRIIGDCGRVKSASPLINDNGVWKMDFADLEARLADPDLELMLLCSPHNPTGRVYAREELNRLCELCLRHGVFIVSDEIHADIVYAPHRHIPLPTLSQAIRDQCMVFLNPSKTFNIPGLRGAAAIIPDAERRQRFLRAAHIAGTGEPSVFGPLALQIAYNECGYYADQLVLYLEANIDAALEHFARDAPQIRVARPEATYMLWLDCRELGLAQPDLNAFMLEKAKVALNAGCDFGPEGAGFMRMNVACPRARLLEGVKRIADAVKKRVS